jgi:phosphinothricin acetyltransferase
MLNMTPTRTKLSGIRKKSSMITFRLAQEADAGEILGIYAPYIQNTVITFEYETPSVDEFKTRIKTIAADYPYIVCIWDGRIIGYAYAHRHMERAAYQWNAELSVYIDQACQRRGVGKALYSALIDILQLQNVRNVYGCVTMPNENSEKLHAYFGFKKLGVYHNAGYKCGAWHDVAWFEKDIGNGSPVPEPFIPIHALDRDALAQILNRYNEPQQCK